MIQLVRLGAHVLVQALVKSRETRDVAAFAKSHRFMILYPGRNPRRLHDLWTTGTDIIAEGTDQHLGLSKPVNAYRFRGQINETRAMPTRNAPDRFGETGRPMKCLHPKWRVCLGLIGLLFLLIVQPPMSALAESVIPGTNLTPSEVKSRVAQVAAILIEWKKKGRDPTDVFRVMAQIEPLVKAGRNAEAIEKLREGMTMVGLEFVEPQREMAESRVARPKVSAASGKGAWTHASIEPVIGTLNRPRGESRELSKLPLTVWNDPSVMVEEGGFAMWASLGTQGGGRGVSIYLLRSKDGLDWHLENGGKPVLEPGKSSEFDWYGVETPAVIKVGSTYHMYYSAYHEPDPKKGGHLFTMGHATSPDGVRWTKRGELLSLTSVVGKRKGNPWGWLARAEPTVVYRNGLFQLYFTDVKCRRADCGGVPSGVRAISLATSKDGHEFKQVGSQPVLLQTDSYPEEEGWEGYSTPWAYDDGSYIQLYVDLFRHLERGHQQTRIAHYRSRDGRNFEEAETDIVQIEGHPWATASVRAPTVVEDQGHIMMWYAGDSFVPSKKSRGLADITSGKLRLGIALVTSP